MAIGWIRVDSVMPQHTKVKRLARKLGDPSEEGRTLACGILLRLWCWAARLAEDGVVSKYEPEEVADEVGWSRDPEELMESLIESGWIDETPEGPVIHDWNEWQGSILRRRVFAKLRAQARRGASGIEAGSECAMCGSDDRLAVDHIIPIARGGDNSPENLRTLCRSCNSEKGSKLDLEWILWKQGAFYAGR